MQDSEDHIDFKLIDMVSTKVFAVSLIVAIIASSAITSAFFLSQVPKVTSSGKQLVNVTDYVAGMTDQNGIVYAPIVEGYYEQNGIVATPVILSGTTAAVEALAADRSGFAFVVEASIFNIVAYESQNPNATKLVSVASMGTVNPVGVLYLMSSGISKPSDLVGRTVGSPFGSLSAQMFDAFLKKAGLEGKVDVQNVAFAQLAPALLAKKVDAIVQYVANVAGLDPQAKKINEAVSFFSLSDYGMPPVGFGVVVQKGLVDNHPDVVKGIVNATMTGIRFCIMDTPRCVADLIRVNPTFDFDIALADMRAHWNYTFGPPFNDPSKVQTLSPLQLGWHDPRSVSEIVQLAEEIYQTSGIDPNSVYTNQFVAERP
jgi:NitT/TauT family transport system substrate-binding protein